MPLTEPHVPIGSIFNPFRFNAISKMLNMKTSTLFILCFLFIVNGAFSQKVKPVELIVECVEYIGDGTYVATFGYDNPNKSEISVAEANSVVVYNYGQSKKNVVNKLLPGRQKNVFTQEFSSKDRCEWRFYLPNETEKTVSLEISNKNINV